MGRPAAPLSARFNRYPGVLTSDVTVIVADRHALPREHRGHPPAARPRLRAHRRLRPRRRPPTARTSAPARPSRPSTPPACPTRRSSTTAIDRVAKRPARRCSRRPWPSRSSVRPSSPAAPPASSSTRSSATASKATARRTKARARPSPRASAPRCCPSSSPSSSIRRAAKSDGTDLNGWYRYDDEGVKARPVDGGRERRAQDVPDVALARSAASTARTATAAGSPAPKWSRGSRT